MTSGEERRLRNMIQHYKLHGYSDVQISRAVHNQARTFTNPAPKTPDEINRFLRGEGLPELTLNELSDPEYSYDPRSA